MSESKLPPGLESLRDNAEAVRRERLAEAEEKAERHWQALLKAAEQSLPAELHSFLDRARPGNFNSRVGDHSFELRLPGHREILCRFQYDRHLTPGWLRSAYHGAPTSDVPGGRANWLVGRRPGADLPSYYQTLGGALAAAIAEKGGAA